MARAIVPWRAGTSWCRARRRAPRVLEDASLRSACLRRVEVGACAPVAILKPLRAVTEVPRAGAEVDEALQRAICDAFLSSARGSDLAVLSGSAPRGFGDDVYARLAVALREAGVRCLVDASGALLRAAAGARPFLVKPNREELEALVGEGIDGWRRRRARPAVRARDREVVVSRAGKARCSRRGPRMPRGRAAAAAWNRGSGDCLRGASRSAERGLPRRGPAPRGECGTAKR